MKKVIIIGAGPAGLMAAIAASSQGAQVVIYEKNKIPGKKLLLTGNGRCNVTNKANTQAFLNQIVTNPRFLYSSLAAFNSADLINFLHSQGVETKEEDQGRMFPASDDAKDILRCLLNVCQKQQVTIKVNAPVEGLWLEDGRCLGILFKGKKIAADATIVATGGLSLPKTGSTGDGYRMAKAAGVKVMPQAPSLVGYQADLKGCDLQGLTLRHVVVTSPKRKSFEGPLLFTHQGVSGPVIFSLSTSLSFMAFPITITVDLFPETSYETLQKKAKDIFAQKPKALVKTGLRSLVPNRLLPYIMQTAGISEEETMGYFSTKRLNSLITLLKALPITLTASRGYQEAMITHGGVSVKEIDPKTMAAKRCDQLYFAGEVLDVDGMTGGYNLQIAWTTGYCAGLHAASL